MFLGYTEPYVRHVCLGFAETFVLGHTSPTLKQKKINVYGAGYWGGPPIDEGGGVGWDGIIASFAVRSHALSTHTSCYAAVRSDALAQIRHATLLYGLMHLRT